MQYPCQRNHGTPAGCASSPAAPSARACADVSRLCRRRQRGLATRLPPYTNTRLTIQHAKPPTFPDNDPVDNPDFDDLVLDDEYYRDMGMSKQDIEDQKAFQASDIDPLGEDLSLESLFKTRKGLPRHLMDQTIEAEKPGWGPEVALLAGFRAEEVVMVRVLLDTLGANDVKVVVSTNDMLHMPAIRALQSPEPAWEEPRDMDSVGYGGGWGAQRTILFAGLSLKAQATLIELLEDGGLPPICATAVTAETANEPVGSLLAEAVREQRGRKPVPSSSDWRTASLPRDATLDPIEELLKQQTTERLKEMADDVAAGSIDHWFEDDDAPEGFTVSLDDVLEARARKRAAKEGGGEASEQGGDTPSWSANHHPEDVPEEPVSRPEKPVSRPEEPASPMEAHDQHTASDAVPEVQVEGHVAGPGTNGSSGGSSNGKATRKQPPVVEAVFTESLPEAAPAAPSDEEAEALLAQYKVVEDDEDDGKGERCDETVPAQDAVDEGLHSKGEEAEEWLLDAIAGGGQASLGDVVAKLGEMGEAARRRAAAQSTSRVSVDAIEEHDAARAAPAMATDRPGAQDPFDFGFRAQTTAQGSVPIDNPLDALREAACVALDAGMSVDDLMAVVDQAARGGAPVMRYRAWSPDGSMVDAPPPTVPDNGNTMSKSELREVAKRHGLSYERLLEDARRKGVVLVD